MPSPYPWLNGLFTQIFRETDVEARAMAENFCCDERPPATGRRLYEGVVGRSPVASLDDWGSLHDRFLEQELFIDAEDLLGQQPWTFRKDNADNWIHPHVAPERKLIRLERADRAASLGGCRVDELMGRVADFRGDDATKHAAARVWLVEFLNKWNANRDLRPVFATYLDEVDDLLRHADWADRLRDRLGMGHWSPGAGGPIPVLLMEYRVEETLSAEMDAPRLAIPTVLDGGINPCFFPTPRPGDGALTENPGGRTVNLSGVSKNDYAYGVELLHPKLDYQPDHVRHSGYICHRPALALDTARSWHLELVRTYMDREAYGGDIGR